MDGKAGEPSNHRAVDANELKVSTQQQLEFS